MRIPFHLFFDSSIILYIPIYSEIRKKTLNPYNPQDRYSFTSCPTRPRRPSCREFKSEDVGNEVRDRPTETKGQPARSGLALASLVLSRPGSIHGPAGAQSESRAGGGGSGSGRGRSANDDCRGAAPETG